MCTKKTNTYHTHTRCAHTQGSRLQSGAWHRRRGHKSGGGNNKTRTAHSALARVRWARDYLQRCCYTRARGITVSCMVLPRSLEVTEVSRRSVSPPTLYPSCFQLPLSPLSLSRHDALEFQLQLQSFEGRVGEGWKMERLSCESCNALRTGHVQWDRITGLNLRLGFMRSQYSRASMFTFRWSMPSWQMSACTAPASHT